MVLGAVADPAGSRPVGRDSVLGWGFEAMMLPVTASLHLKSDVNCLGAHLLIRETLADFTLYHPLCKMADTIVVDEAEAYAANAICINGVVLLPAGFPKVMAAVKARGYEVRDLPMSEFRKLDGGLTCLSLLY